MKVSLPVLTLGLVGLMGCASPQHTQSDTSVPIYDVDGRRDHVAEAIQDKRLSNGAYISMRSTTRTNTVPVTPIRFYGR